MHRGCVNCLGVLINFFGAFKKKKKIFKEERKKGVFFKKKTL